MARSHFRLAPALLLAAAFGLTGACVKTDDTVKVAKDGSGSFVEDFVLDLKAMESLKTTMDDLKKNFGNMGGIPGMPGMPPGGETPPAPAMDGDKPPEAPPAPPPAPPVEDRFAKLQGLLAKIDGLEVTKLEKIESEGKSGFHIEANFKTLEAYAKGSQRGSGAELTKNEDGSYTLTFTNGLGGSGHKPRKPHGPGAGEPPAMGGDAAPMEGEPAPMAGEPPAAMEGEPAAMDGGGDPMGGLMGGGAGGGFGGMMGGMLSMLAPSLEQTMSGLELVRKLTLPGTIVSTNGVKGEDGSSVSWKFTWKDYHGGKLAPETVTFSGEGLDLKPFKVGSHRDMIPTIPGMPGGIPGMPGGTPR